MISVSPSQYAAATENAITMRWSFAPSILPPKALPPTRKRVKILLPFSMGGAGAELRKTGVVHSEEYTADGLLLDITAEIFVLEKYKDYII